MVRGFDGRLDRLEERLGGERKVAMIMVLPPDVAVPGWAEAAAQPLVERATAEAPEGIALVEWHRDQDAGLYITFGVRPDKRWYRVLPTGPEPMPAPRTITVGPPDRDGEQLERRSGR